MYSCGAWDILALFLVALVGVNNRWHLFRLNVLKRIEEER